MHIFPTGLDNSLFPAIFIGVLLTFLAVETLGWSFTGLVVPGYLASVALVAPHAVGLMLVEALVTLALVRLLGDGAALARVGSRFFGRERFFMTLALATGVRLALDGVGVALSGAEAPVHSIGLVLVPLLTHTLDRAGLQRGLVQIVSLTTVTGLLVALLVRVTNLTLADLSLTFEDMALRIDQSPTGYVVLLCGALLAARANVAFGWDFHGIIVPGLLAVAWFTPAKVAITLVEALAVLVLARALVRLPGLRGVQVEGARRLMILFVADAILKVAVVVVGGAALPMMRPSDLYGFGYLLPTLLAAKIQQRGSVGRVLLPAAQVSFGGFILGNALILGFSWLAAWLAPAASTLGATAAAPTTFERAAALARTGVATEDGLAQLSAEEADRWHAAWRRFAAGAPPAQAFGAVAGVVVSAIADEPGAIVVREPVGEPVRGSVGEPGRDGARAAAAEGGPRGLGTVIARPTGRAVIVAVPQPLDGDLTLAAADLVRALDARALVVAGWTTPAPSLFSTPYGVAFAETTRDAWVVLTVDERAPAEGIVRVGPAVWPDEVRLDGVRSVFPRAHVTWIGRGREVEIAAPARAWTEVAARPCAAAAGLERLAAPAGLAEHPTGSPPAGDVLDPAERLLYADGIVAPLARAARAGGGTGATCRAAQAIGLAVETVRDADGERHLVVRGAGRGAPTAIVRVGEAEETIVGAPGGDLATRRAALALYVASPARAAVLGPSAGHAGPSSYDAALGALADVAAETIGGAGRDAAGGVVVEVRGSRAAGPLPWGGVLAWGGVTGTPGSAPPWLAVVERALARVGLPARRYDGADALAPYSGMDSSRRAALGRRGTGVVALFLSEDLRARRFGADGILAAVALAEELGLPRDATPLDAVFRARAPETSCADLGGAFRHARRFTQLRHVADLRAAVRPGVRLAVDPVTGEAGLVAASPCGAFAVNLRAPDLLPAPALTLPTETPPTPELLRRIRHGGLSALYHGDTRLLGDPPVGWEER